MRHMESCVSGNQGATFRVCNGNGEHQREHWEVVGSWGYFFG